MVVRRVPEEVWRLHEVVRKVVKRVDVVPWKVHDVVRWPEG